MFGRVRDKLGGHIEKRMAQFFVNWAIGILF